MRDIPTMTFPLSRPVCPECNSFMRLARIEPHVSGQREDYFAYACMGCDQMLELAIDARERFALHASTAAPG